MAARPKSPRVSPQPKRPVFHSVSCTGSVFPVLSASHAFPRPRQRLEVADVATVPETVRHAGRVSDEVRGELTAALVHDDIATRGHERRPPQV